MYCIIEDTRNKQGKHRLKNEHFANRNIAITRSKLAVGDYCLPPDIAVDTKADIAELAMDIIHEHERFRAECIAARDMGTLLVVLVENVHGIDSLEALGKWVEPTEAFKRRRNARERLRGGRLAKACSTMANRYGVRFEFCSPEEAGPRIVELLEVGHDG